MWNCPEINVTGPGWWVDVGSGNDLVPSGNKPITLQWRHNERDGVSNHQPPGCLLNRLFKAQIKETLKLRVTGLCDGNSPMTGEFPAQRASNAENVSIWWRHHVKQCWPISLTQYSVTRLQCVNYYSYYLIFKIQPWPCQARVKHNSLYCFSVPVIGCLGFLAVPITRYILSCLVSPEENGMFYLSTNW